MLPAEIGSRVDAWWGLFVIVVLLIVLLVFFQPDPYRDLLVFLGDGIWVTVYVTVISFILTLIAGLIGGLGRLSTNPLIYGISTLYVELVRGIPLLVQLIWWYFAFPLVLQSFGRAIGVEALSRYQANAIAMSVVGLTFCYGAYMSEVYRAGIQSIPKGQMEAAMSLGMNYFQAMRYIILPQAIRVILPPVGNEFIALLKDSSLVSAVAVADLTRRGREFMSSNFNPIETWTMVALVYLVMTLFSARVASYIERKAKVAER
jgi:polar amino acid transport system permease protein